jgi:hypothetical protein
MNRRLRQILFLVFLLSLILATVALAQDEKLYRVDIRNNTDQMVTLVLTGESLPSYVLNVPAGTGMLFTIEEGIYAHTTFACSESATGTLVVRQQLRFNFTPCFGPAPNAGEPSMEKIHIPETPDGFNWLFHFD